jgi:hypothetical protein
MVLQTYVDPGLFFSFAIFFTQMVGLLGQVISPSQGRYLNTEQHKHRVNAYTDIHALSGIRTHDPSIRASEAISCLRPRGHCDRQIVSRAYIYMSTYIHHEGLFFFINESQRCSDDVNVWGHVKQFSSCGSLYLAAGCYAQSRQSVLQLLIYYSFYFPCINGRICRIVRIIGS